jgi:hypothetical protein
MALFYTCNGHLVSLLMNFFLNAGPDKKNFFLCFKCYQNINVTLIKVLKSTRRAGWYMYQISWMYKHWCPSCIYQYIYKHQTFSEQNKLPNLLHLKEATSLYTIYSDRDWIKGHNCNYVININVSNLEQKLYYQKLNYNKLYETQGEK